MLLTKGDARRSWRPGLLLLVLLLAGKSTWAEEFSVVVLPDPQIYAARFPEVGLAQTEWIRENVKKLHIHFVVTVGDNVDAGYSDEQYQNSTRFMGRLDGVVPYGVTVGNHEFKVPLGSGEEPTGRKFVEYYGPQRFKKYDWYGGASKSGFSSCQIFSGGGYEFLAISLAVSAPKEEVDWARKVIAKHPGMPVILTTHQMINPKGEFGKGPAIKGDQRQSPEQVWEQLVEPSPEIFLVLCGHYTGESRMTKETRAPQPVHVVLQDYQKDPNGGDGWLRIFTFRPEQKRIDVQTYSPTLKEYRKGERSEFSLPVDFQRLPAPAAVK